MRWRGEARAAARAIGAETHTRHDDDRVVQVLGEDLPLEVHPLRREKWESVSRMRATAAMPARVATHVDEGV